MFPDATRELTRTKPPRCVPNAHKNANKIFVNQIYVGPFLPFILFNAAGHGSTSYPGRAKKKTEKKEEDTEEEKEEDTEEEKEKGEQRRNTQEQKQGENRKTQ